MTQKILIINDDNLDDLAERISAKMMSNQNQQSLENKELPHPKDDYLFKSLKEASLYFGVCYQTLSKNLDKIKHFKVGKKIMIYRADLENYFVKSPVFSNS